MRPEPQRGGIVTASHELWLDLSGDPAGARAGGHEFNEDGFCDCTECLTPVMVDCPSCGGQGAFVDSGHFPIKGAPNYRAADLWQPAEEDCTRCGGRGWVQ